MGLVEDVAAIGAGGELVLPRGRYEVDGPLDLSNRRLVGTNWCKNLTGFAPDYIPFATVLEMGEGGYIYADNGPMQLESLVIKGRPDATAINCYKTNGPQSWIKAVTVIGADVGLLQDECGNMTTRYFEVKDGRIGIHAINSNACDHLGVRLAHNTEAGLDLERDPSRPGAGNCRIKGTVEYNGYGVRMSGIGARVIIEACHIEANNLDSIFAEDCMSPQILHNRITSGSSTGRSVVLKNCGGARVVGNRLGRSHAELDDWQSIHLDSCKFAEVRGNLYQGIDTTDGKLGGGMWFDVVINGTPYHQVAHSGILTDGEGEPVVS